MHKAITEEASEKEIKHKAATRSSNASSVGMFYLDAVISVDLAIKHAQHSMWKALQRAVPEFNISMVEEAQKFLKSMQNPKLRLLSCTLIL